jgi:hypothetical protein
MGLINKEDETLAPSKELEQELNAMFESAG